MVLQIQHNDAAALVSNQSTVNETWSALKRIAIQIFSIAFGTISLIHIARHRSLVVGLPLIATCASLSSMGLLYPELILNKISDFFLKRINRS